MLVGRSAGVTKGGGDLIFEKVVSQTMTSSPLCFHYCLSEHSSISRATLPHMGSGVTVLDHVSILH